MTFLPGLYRVCSHGSKFVHPLADSTGFTGWFLLIGVPREVVGLGVSLCCFGPPFCEHWPRDMCHQCPGLDSSWLRENKYNFTVMGHIFFKHLQTCLVPVPVLLFLRHSACPCAAPFVHRHRRISDLSISCSSMQFFLFPTCPNTMGEAVRPRPQPPRVFLSFDWHIYSKTNPLGLFFLGVRQSRFISIFPFAYRHRISLVPLCNLVVSSFFPPVQMPWRYLYIQNQSKSNLAPLFTAHPNPC